MNLNKIIKNLLTKLIIPKLLLPYSCKKLTAFTLAEVLITLLIIGVVASLVVPTLITDTQQAEMITAWKKAYGIISQAQLGMIKDYSSVNGAFSGIEDSLDGSNSFMNGWLPYLSISKKCTTGRILTDGCHNVNFKSLNNTTITNYNSLAHDSGVVLNDGTFINFYVGVCSGNLCDDAYLFIDINGTKGPNTLGKDVLAMRYLPEKDRFVARGDGSACSYQGWDCAAYYLKQ